MQTELSVRCSECGDWLLDSDDPMVLCPICSDSKTTDLARAEEAVDDLRNQLDEMEMDRNDQQERAERYRDLLEDLAIPKKSDHIPGYAFMDEDKVCCCFCLLHWEHGDPEQHDKECPVWRAQEELGL